MNEFLTELKDLFVNASQYTSVFGTVLNANFAREGSEFPLAVYTMNPVEKVSKDGDLFSVEVSFYFAIEQFPQCVAFYDAIKPVIETSDFISEIFTPVTDYDLDLNKIVVNIKKIKGLTIASGGGNTDGGGNTGGGGSNAAVNFTDFTTSPNQDNPNSATDFNFTGGNEVGITEWQFTDLNITSFSGQLEGSQRTVSIGFGIGTFTMRWRRINGNYTSSWLSKTFEVINSGIRGLRLVTAGTPTIEFDVQFPVIVAQITTSGNTNDVKINSGIVANDSAEFITIWNQLNGSIGTITSAEFKIIGAYRWWEFNLVMNDYQYQPTAAWCYLI